MKKIKFVGGAFFVLFCNVAVEQTKAMTLTGPFVADSVTVSGSVSISSMTVSTTSVTNLLDVTGSVSGIKGLILQTKFSSGTFQTDTTTTTYQAVFGISQTISLFNANNSVRISLSGLLNGGNLTIKRDSVDLGQGTPLAYALQPDTVPVGITITDSPGDTSSHTYQVFIAANPGSASFATNPVSFLLLEEVAQ